MLSITVSVLGTKEEIAKFNKLGDGLRDFSTPMKAIGTEMTHYFAGQVFASGGAALNGKKWKALNAVYRRRKAKQYPGRGALVRTGLLQHAFDYRSDINSVVIENLAPYAKYHQSSEPRTTMPRRQFMGINDDVKTIVHDIIQADIQRKLRAL